MPPHLHRINLIHILNPHFIFFYSSVSFYSDGHGIHSWTTTLQIYNKIFDILTGFWWIQLKQINLFQEGQQITTEVVFSYCLVKKFSFLFTLFSWLKKKKIIPSCDGVYHSSIGSNHQNLSFDNTLDVEYFIKIALFFWRVNFLTFCELS